VLTVSCLEPVPRFGIVLINTGPAFQTTVFRLLPQGPSIHVHALEWLSALG